MQITNFSDVEALKHRLTVTGPERPFVFLVGAPLTGSGSFGVADVRGMQELVKQRLPPQVAQRAEDEADPGGIYQALMAQLGAHAGQGAVNEVIREGVLKAWIGMPLSTSDREALTRAESEPHNWQLTAGVRALGEILCTGDRRFPPIVLTTNFDPLIEVSIRAAGGVPVPLSLEQDARFDHPMPGLVKVVHLCGFWREHDTLHVQSQLQMPRPKLADALRQLLRNHTLVTLAYGGWADAVALAITDNLALGGAPFDLLWTFFGRQKKQITRDNQELLARLEPALGGRAQLYCGVDAHQILPELLGSLHPATRAPTPVGRDPWSATVQASQIVQGPSGDPLRDGVSRLVARLWPFWEASKAVPDPWRHEQLPVRLLRILDLLIGDRITLYPAERAILTAAPFVREAVMAAGVKLLADHDVEFFDEAANARPIRQALEAVHRGRPNLLRRAHWLTESGHPEDARGVAWWLAHRMLLRRTLLWVPRHEPGGELADDLLAALTPDPGNEYLQQALEPRRLLRVAKCIAAADRLLLPGSEYLKQLRDNDAIGGSRPEPVRETLLARLLHLSGWLALDPRHLDELVVEQIGVTPPLTPWILIETLSKLQWLHDPHGRLRLSGTSSHAAIELALRTHVELADVTRERLMQHDTNLSRFPTRFIVDTIEPALDTSNRRMWERPHLRFELAATEIREMLMGEQLYGDASVALRELYQNALDALRYREARQEFLQQCGRLHSADQSWKGQITITQSRVGGKFVITCRDNGVGMGLEELTGAFARAGRRFRDLPVFAEEEAEWLSCRHPIRVYPNSQFGVGVLSYFMLADEVRIRTTRFNRDGSLGPELHVTIAGAGALFHVREEHSQGRDAGTEIELILSPQRFEQKAPSVVDTLQYWLVVADFDTHVTEGTRSLRWTARVPSGFADAVHIPNSEPPCWWVPEQGMILADGLKTEQIEVDTGAFYSSAPHGVILNLTGRFRPRLSVNRRCILGWRPEVAHDTLISGISLLATKSFVSIEWLEKFASYWPMISDRIAAFFMNQDSRLPVVRMGGQLFPVARVGFCSADAKLWDAAMVVPSARYSMSDLDGGLPAIDVERFAHRLRAWKNDASTLPADVASLIQYLPDDEPGCDIPVILPGDVAIANAFPNASDSELSGLLIACAKMRISLGEAIERLHRIGFTTFGDRAASIDTSALRHVFAPARTVRALLGLKNLEDDEHSPSTQSLEIPVAPGRVVRMSTDLGISLEKGIAIVRSFEALGVTMAIPAGESPKIEIESGDVVALSLDSDGLPDWLCGDVPLGNIYRTAKCLHELPSATIRRLRRYQHLGIHVPDLDLTALDRLQGDDHSILGPFLQGPTRYLPWRITRQDLWLASAGLGIAPSEAARCLQRYHCLGLSLPDAPGALDSIPRSEECLLAVAMISNRDWRGALVQELYGYRRRIPHQAIENRILVLKAVRGLYEPELAELIDRFADAARVVTDNNAVLFLFDELHWLSLDPEMRSLRHAMLLPCAKFFGVRLPDVSAMPPHVAPPIVRMILSACLDRRSSVVSGGASRLHLALAAGRVGETYENVLKIYSQWAPAFYLSQAPIR